MIERPEPDLGEDFAAYLAKWELIRLQANRFAEQNKKLVEFVKQLADDSVYERYENLNEMNWSAFELLKEIGEL